MIEENFSKNFYQCSFCKQVFAKNHQQLKIHIKEFHKFEEEDFQIKSNKLIEENWMIQMKLMGINQNLSREKKNKAEITNVKSMKKRNSTTYNEKKESQCLSSISIESKRQRRKKERNVQSKKDLNNLEDNNIEDNNIEIVTLEEYDDNVIKEQDSTKKQNSTTSNEKKESQCLSSISIESKNQPKKKERNVESKKNLKNLENNNIKVVALKEYDDNIIEEQNTTTSCKKRKMERGLPSISCNSECQPTKKRKK